MTVRLTQLAKRAGCAAKQPPGYLFSQLGRLAGPRDPNVLIGNATADDAAVYRLDDTRALVLTTDFFTPVVDSPFDFGRVAAANALSDVYAMGGKPLTALNLVGFPDHLLAPAVLGDILEGGSEIAAQAGIDIIGGHTIKADEPIYGLSVTGLVHPDRVVSNAGGRPGDRLVLTKPIGIGIVTTAAKQNLDTLDAIGTAIALMTTLNARASEAMQQVGVHAATDITGFGLLGHLRNMTSASGVSADIEVARVPFIDAARTYVARGIVPGGTHANRRFLLGQGALGAPDAGRVWVEFAPHITEAEQLLVCDAQTSGGLLIAVPADREAALHAALAERGIIGATIGQLAPGQGTIRVR